MPVQLPDPKLFKVECDERARWSDTDALGHVNNARYFGYFESARVEYFKRVAPQMNLVPGGEGVIIARTWCDFVAQLDYDTAIKVGARTVKLGRSSWELEHLVRDARDGTVYAVGGVTLVWFDYATHQPKPIPDDVRRRIDAVEQG